MTMLFDILCEVLGISLLSIPLIWEVWNDKNGDAHISRVAWNENIQMLSKRVDVYARCALAASASMANIFVTHHNIFQSGFLSFAIHFLLFDYIIAYVLMKNRVIDHIYNRWYSYLGQKGMIDNLDAWQNKTWKVRMAIKIAVFIIACVMYF